MLTSIATLGSNAKHLKALEFAKNMAITKAPALIIGESGTGKKSISTFIHQNSSRAKAGIIFVDCAKDSMKVENEILGFRDEETGKFNRGALERANGGTVVLCNIDALDERFQKRLYQIIMELGDYELDVRVLATTSKNLNKYVGAGRFHRALFTYFSACQINLVPLREREEDVPLIASEIAKELAVTNGLSELKITDDAYTKLGSFYWTHNLSELVSVMKNSFENARSGVIDTNAIELGEKKAEIIALDSDEGGFKLMSLRDAERLLIKKALIHTSENRTQAAKILGVSIRTLRNKINEYRTEGNNYFVNLR
jgi:two-component system response regulator FlrC